MADAYIPLPIFQPSGLRTVGIPYDSKPHPEDADAEVMLCPLCGAELVEDSLMPGTGFAFGGYGTYWYCDTPDCEWYYKEMARDGE